jgi:hypothetical protein
VSDVLNLTQYAGLRWDKCDELVSEEVKRARAVRFFEYETHSISPWKLTIQGVVSHQKRYGGIESLRIRLEYGPGFPDKEPCVFDHDEVFSPIARGHKFPNHGLCLRFPYRETFSKDPALVTAEVLEASLHWVIKRNIFERTGEWPGETEEHGFARPLRALVFERALATGNGYLLLWAEVALALSLIPRMDAACPCQSGRPVKNCHADFGRLLRDAIFATELQSQSQAKNLSGLQGDPNALRGAK